MPSSAVNSRTVGADTSSSVSLLSCPARSRIKHLAPHSICIPYGRQAHTRPSSGQELLSGGSSIATRNLACVGLRIPWHGFARPLLHIRTLLAPFRHAHELVLPRVCNAHITPDTASRIHVALSAPRARSAIHMPRARTAARPSESSPRWGRPALRPSRRRPSTASRR